MVPTGAAANVGAVDGAYIMPCANSTPFVMVGTRLFPVSSTSCAGSNRLFPSLAEQVTTSPVSSRGVTVTVCAPVLATAIAKRIRRRIDGIRQRRYDGCDRVPHPTWRLLHIIIGVWSNLDQVLIAQANDQVLVLPR